MVGDEVESPLGIARGDGQSAAPGDSPWAAGVLPAALLGLLAVSVAVVGLALRSGHSVNASDLVRIGLITAWAIAGVCAVRDREVRKLGHIVGIGALLGGIAFGAARIGDAHAGTSGAVARFLATLACPLVMALSAHALLSLPRGELNGLARQRSVVVAYVTAAFVGLGAWAWQGHVSIVAGAVGWILALALSLPAAHQRYLKVAGVDRQRLQWLGCGAVVAAELALVVGALHVFVGWPGPTGSLAASATVLIPLALAASTSPKLVGRADRLLVLTVSVTGLTLVVVTVYLIIVIGLGGSPDAADRRVLGLSMLAAAIAAVCYVPARQRLTELATGLVYGEREAPDEVLRTFGSRLTRAIPMDELLLQLVESLRRTMALSAAEIWTGGGDVLERTVSVPDKPPARVAVGERERPIVARAGVSGNAWASVWLPLLLDGRANAPIRVASITHSGALLGLIVVERPRVSDAFTEDDDRVLVELARQVGLALHNVQLDSALQATLDEVRIQAEELRASRTRIVATADAERRKIERNLHDGAQQHLVALAVNLRLIKDMVSDDPQGAAEMLDAMAADVKETIQELRDLAHGIYPPLLLDSGLVEALRAAAGRNPLDVRVDAEGIGRYDADLEAAVYFCCLEALQNAAKHAPGARVEVRVREESGGLLFEVVDDGPGFGPSAASGHGFMNMSDRLGAIGGSVRWEPNEGSGALVAGSIPFARRRAGT